MACVKSEVEDAWAFTETEGGGPVIVECREDAGCKMKRKSFQGPHQLGPCNTTILRILELYPKSNEVSLKCFKRQGKKVGRGEEESVSEFW